MLELQGVCAGYGQINILRNVSLDINDGEIVALIGPNGAGKTTLLRTISGLIRATAGEIRYRGRDLRAAEPAEIVRAGIAHCPEGRKVWPAMTVEENLELGAFVRTNNSEIRKSLEGIYQRFPVLRERRRDFAGRLSGGQQQILAVARTLMADPKLVMFDEPSLGLSPALMRQIATIVLNIHREGVTVLLVEQNVELALHLANQVYVLGSGRIVAHEKAKSLRSNSSLLKTYLGG
jgi:branched-chain amino acid transport system ATP-binding protein